MPSSPITIQLPPLLNKVVLAAGIVVILLGMQAISSILNAFLLAILLATICVPVQFWLERKGADRWIAFGVTYVLTLVIGLSTVFFMALALAQVIATLPKYQEQLHIYIQDFRSALGSISISDAAMSVAEIDDTAMARTARAVLQAVVDSLGMIGLMYLFLFYVLMEGRNLGDRLTKALGADDPFVIHTGQFVRDARSYLGLRTVMGAVIAALQTVVMEVMGVDFALLWGMLSFICNYIPTIGFMIAIIPPTILLFLEQGIGPTIVFVFLYILCNSPIKNIFGPRLYGNRINLSPLTLSVSLVLWVWVLGPLGAILALPMTLFMKEIVLSTDDSTRAVIAIISSSRHEKAPKHESTPPSEQPTA